MAVMRIARSDRVYYGWFIVGAALLAQFAAQGSQGFTLGAFMKPMADDLGWSRGAISGVQSVSTIVAGILGLFIGGVLDRRGARALMIIGAVIAGLGFLLLSAINEVWQFYAIRGLFVGVGSTFASMMVANTAVSNWFVRKRGRAVAISVMGFPLAGIILLPFTQFVIQSFNWRTAWIVLGLLVWVVAIAPTAIFMRRRPEDLGLVPDGSLPPPESEAHLNAAQKAVIRADVKWTRAEAMRTSTLWMIMVGCGLGAMTNSMTMMHLMPYVSDHGFTATVAAFTASVHSMFSLVSKPVWGIIIERVHARLVGAMTYSIAAAGLVVLIFARPFSLSLALGPLALGLEVSLLQDIILGMAILGIGIGGVMPVGEVIWASYFGRISLGTIRSLGMPATIVSSAGGPLVGGLVYDWTKSYTWAFIVLIGTLSLGAMILFTLRPARRPEPVQAAATA